MRKRKRTPARKNYGFSAKKLFRGTIVIAVTLFIISRFMDVRLALFLIIAITFNAALQKFVLKKGLPADFELSTFISVITAMAYGIKMGLFVAVLSKLVANFATADFKADHFLMIFTYSMAATVASIFPNADILWLGLGITVMNNLIMFFMSQEILGLDITSNISYTFTNFMLNLLIFTTIARPALVLVG